MFTPQEITEIRDQQITLRDRRDPLFSVAVLQACESALSVQDDKVAYRGRTRQPSVGVNYWWMRD